MIQEIREELALIDKYLSNSMKESLLALNSVMGSNGSITSGNGTSYNAAYYLSLLFLKRNIFTIPIFASEFSKVLVDKFDFKNTSIIFFSQSGETADVISAAKSGKSNGAFSISISNVPGSSLSTMSDVSIITPAGPEKSIAATKSHMGQLLSSISIFFADRPGEFKHLLGNIREGFNLIMSHEDEIKNIAENITNKVVFLGSGLEYPVAREGALKLKETSSTVADAYPVREFLHGPKQILDDTWTVFMLSREDAVMSDLSKLTHNLLYVDRVIHKQYNVKFSSDFADSIIKVLFVQLLAYYRSVFLGLDPDRPSKLTKVIKS
jgi:glucosamine--fructose-6-phosphate aminotransferase (isomerizing)